jgi:hypothetical protein
VRMAKAQLIAQALILAVFGALTWPTLTIWKDSIPWLQFLSIFAIVEGAAGGVAAAWAAVEAAKKKEGGDQ